MTAHTHATMNVSAAHEHEGHDHQHADRLEWIEFVRIACVAAAAAAVWFRIWEPWPRSPRRVLSQDEHALRREELFRNVRLR
jgi:hypothetical protein